MEITQSLYYVGVNDRQKHLFESLWEVPFGVSYNSYLLKTDIATALFETVDVAFFEEFLASIKEVLGDRELDYLIINHTEPDHSGSIALLKQYYPNLRLVGNKKTLDMIEGYYGLRSQADICVEDGSELQVGAHRLSFHLTPMIHWPETMMTYDHATHTLFSGDAFGAFGALNGAVLDKDLDICHFWKEMERYYANIVGKYGAMVTCALEKLADFPIKYICATHGPVWMEEVPAVIDTYRRLASYEGSQGAVICYASMYGNTTKMAEAVARGLVVSGIKKVIMHDVSRSPLSYIIADIFRYRGLVLGAPTYNGTLFPPMQALLEELKIRSLKNRQVAYFGSFTWAGQAVKIIKNFIEQMKGLTAVEEGVENKQGFTKDTADKCYQLGQQLARKLQEQ